MDISVIIPTLNEEGTIRECLESIKNQKTDLEFETIVCDGRSEDRTAEIAKEYATVIESDIRSVGIQRNRGAAASTGKYLLFLDADTILPGNYLEKVNEKWTSYPALHAFSASFRFIESGKKLAVSEKIVNSYFLFRSNLGVATLPGFNINIKRSIFDTIGGFKDVPLEDVDLSISLSRYGRTRYFSDFYVFTSARRLEEMGILGTVRYYLEVDLVRKNWEYKNFLRYNDYVACRKRYQTLPELTAGYKLNGALHEYIIKKVEGTFKPENLKAKVKERLVEDITRVSKSIADIGLRASAEKADVDSAIKMIKEKINALKMRI